ncbi:hypothetical protein C0J52_01369 [Blattella germanica]|nr:hypothetical protein C0J52_01369 [Blattella germanica]
MVLTTEENIFIFKHYLLSYRVWCQNGPSLCHIREQFNKIAPSNKIILAIIEKFRRTGSV